MTIKKFENFENDNYMLGKPTYKWVKTLLTKNFYRIEPKDTTRSIILQNRKTDLKLNEFQQLFDYYNFCDTVDIELLYNNISRYKSIIRDWVWYLTICQLFPNEMKNAGEKRNLYDRRYDEILSLPNLTGNIEEDKNIFMYVIKEHFFSIYKNSYRNLHSYI